MFASSRCLAVAVAVAVAVAASPWAAERQVITLTAEETSSAREFEKRLKDYLALHRRLEATLPKLSKEATAQEIDKNQRALGAKLKAERAGAKRGEFFTPSMEGLVRRTMKAVITGRDGKTIKASIMDENPGERKLSVNDRYPDSIPLSTMPPDVLGPLPKLEEDLEYRFVGDRLVLLDAHAHIIIDFTNDVLP